MSDHIAEAAVYLLFAAILCGSALLAWEQHRARRHLAFAARQAALTVVAIAATLMDADPLTMLLVIALMAVNVWTYQPKTN